MSTTTKIALADLHDSPSNPRKHFDEAALAELAADIKHHGRVLQPICVRPRVPALFANAGDPDAQCGFEIIFGHRRARAAELAGLQEIDAMVTSMTDAEVARAQISENLARQDVHPIEEAEGFQALMADHSVSADDLVQQTGKSRSYVYGRLKLLQAAPQVRQACLAGEFGSEIALLIARVGGHPTQQEALEYLAKVKAYPAEGGKLSYRRIKELLAERYTLDLDDAIFSITSTTLHAKAGACTACPKRVGHDPAFDDLAEPPPPRYQGEQRKPRTGACTDPDCFSVKKAQHLQDVALTLQEQGHTVLGPKQTKAAFTAYGTLNTAKFAPATLALLAEAKHHGLKPITIISPNGEQIKAFKADDVKRMQPSTGSGTSSNSSPARMPEDQRIELANAETAARKSRLFDLTWAWRNTDRTAAEACFVALALFDALDYWGDAREELCEAWALPDDSGPKAMLARLQELTPAELARFMLHVACITFDIKVSPYDINTSPEDIEPNIVLDGLAALHGISIAPASQPLPPAARAPQGAAASAKGTVAYRCPATGQSWSGRGLKPKWLQAALAEGKTLADFAVGQTADASAARAPTVASGEGEASAQENASPVLGSAEQGLAEGADAPKGAAAGATAEA